MTSGAHLRRRFYLTTEAVELVRRPGANGALNGQNAGQGGDQFLDGIGETSLVARYVFNGNVEDSSRNQLHATMRGAGGAFVEEPVATIRRNALAATQSDQGRGRGAAPDISTANIPTESPFSARLINVPDVSV